MANHRFRHDGILFVKFAPREYMRHPWTADTESLCFTRTIDEFSRETLEWQWLRGDSFSFDLLLDFQLVPED